MIRAIHRPGPWFTLLCTVSLACALADVARAEPPAAFARASPLSVYASAKFDSPVDVDFQFGRTYDVLEQTATHLRVRLPDGSTGYVKPETMFIIQAPTWLASTNMFATTSRPNLRLWKEQSDLKDYLSGKLDREWDFEEFLDDAPRFSMRFPVTATTTTKAQSLGRDVTLVTALVPVPGDAFAEVSNIKDGKGLRTSVHVVADMSGSARNFTEPALLEITELLSRKDLKGLIGDVTLTRFASSYPTLAEHSGPFSVAEFAKDSVRTISLAGRGPDAEPLLPALATTIEKAKGREAASTALIILSGADVDPAPITSGKSTTADQLKLPENTTTFVAQITPEPGEELLKMARSFQRTTLEYVPYSQKTARALSIKLAQLFEKNKKQAISAGAFKSYSQAARNAKMIPILPREMETDGINLPPPPKFARNAKWYTVPLSLAVDGLVYTVDR